MFNCRPSLEYSFNAALQRMLHVNATWAPSVKQTAAPAPGFYPITSSYQYWFLRKTVSECLGVDGIVPWGHFRMFTVSPKPSAWLSLIRQKKCSLLSAVRGLLDSTKRNGPVLIWSICLGNRLLQRHWSNYLKQISMDTDWRPILCRTPMLIFVFQ